MKIYIAGKITGNDNFKEEFERVDNALKAKGHITTNPAILPDGFSQKDYMKICLSMLDCCDAILLMNNWKESKRATIEYLYAEKVGIFVIEEDWLNLI